MLLVEDFVEEFFLLARVALAEVVEDLVDDGVFGKVLAVARLLRLRGRLVEGGGAAGRDGVVAVGGALLEDGAGPAVAEAGLV